MYPKSFRQRAVVLYRKGQTFQQVADSLKVNRETIRPWVRASGKPSSALSHVHRVESVSGKMMRTRVL